MAKPSLALPLLLLCVSPVAAQDAARVRSPRGVEVTPPPGFQRAEAKGNTALRFVGEGDDPPAVVINVMKMSPRTSEKSLFRLARTILGRSEVLADETVEVESGRYQRLDVATTHEGRELRQRCYVGLRNGYGYWFFLNNTDPKAFETHAPAFEAFVKGASYFQPTAPEP
ncbi:MAG TPA: hypothetical protein DEA08_20970, partial [Planctomycetes bacterium]|nr:hypothetical protein [Planctomycetota bacterium]